MRPLHALALLCLAALLGGCGATSPFVAPTGTTAEARVKADKELALAISKAIYTDEALRHAVHINVNAVNGVVLLTGEAPEAALRKRAVDLARRISGVRRVHDEIAILPKASLASRTRDGWLAGRAKRALAKEPRLADALIAVVAERQSLYLMGRVTRQQASLAAEIARRLDGVKEVVTLFDYRD